MFLFFFCHPNNFVILDATAIAKNHHGIFTKIYIFAIYMGIFLKFFGNKFYQTLTIHIE